MKKKSCRCGHPHQPGPEPHNQENRVVDGNKWEHWSQCIAEVEMTQSFLETCNCESLDMSVVTDMTKRVKVKSEKVRKGQV